MPQASEAYRALMNKWFDDPISLEGPEEFLRARGWTFPGGVCTPPTPAHQPSAYEYACICFLCHEWDYGYGGKLQLVDLEHWA